MELAELLEKVRLYGLDEGEATVYFHLSRMGGARASDVALAAKRKRPDTYRILDALVRKGFAEKTLERPTRFLATPIDVALRRCVEVRHKQADALQASAQELVEAWPRSHADAGPGNQRFTVYQGREQVAGLMQRMFGAAEDEVIVVASPGGLAHLGLAPFLESLQAGSDVDLRVLTKPDADRHEEISRLRGADIRLAELPSYHQMVIVDARQIALFVSSGRKLSTQGDVQTVLWLNSPDFVLAQKALFDAVWATALSLEERERAADAGELPKETRLLRGRWQRYDRMRRMIDHARHEVQIHAPKEEVARWTQAGVLQSLQNTAATVTVSSDGILDLPGIRHVRAPSSGVVCLVDGVQSLVVHGAREGGGAVAYENEWAIWSTHPDAIAALQAPVIERLAD